MSLAKWKLVRFSDGMFGLHRTTDTGHIEYEMPVGARHPRKWVRQEDAVAWGARLNGEPALPSKLTDDEFKAQTNHVPMSIQMRGAIHDITVKGMTWKTAADKNNVTESGILRAMRRIVEANHPVAQPG